MTQLIHLIDVYVGMFQAVFVLKHTHSLYFRSRAFSLVNQLAETKQSSA